MKDKRIAFFLGSMGRGGAERVISILSNDYAKCGWKTDIGLLLFNKVEYILNESTRIIDMSGSCGSRLLRAPMWLKSIRSYVKSEKPDVIVTFAARINVLVLLACLGLNVKIVASERNDPMYDGRGLVTRVMTSLLYPIADTIVFQTKRVKNQFGKRIRKNGVVIPNPITVNAESIDVSSKKIVSVGRLTKQKNHRMLLKAFSDVVKKYSEYKLYIYGEGELRQELQEYVEELGLSNNVFLPGNVLNIHEKISDAEMFVLSSDYEGLSNALLEAMMMGLPCIATNCAGSDEYINDGCNGKLVQVGNIENMKNAILCMIEQPEHRKIMGENAKRSSVDFSAKSVLEKWHNVIDN